VVPPVHNQVIIHIAVGVHHQSFVLASNVVEAAAKGMVWHE
jgi:hypothetical protein